MTKLRRPFLFGERVPRYGYGLRKTYLGPLGAGGLPTWSGEISDLKIGFHRKLRFSPLVQELEDRPLQEVTGIWISVCALEQMFGLGRMPDYPSSGSKFPKVSD
jgi:hypothetical protein